MRTIVDLPEEHVKALDQLRERQRCSRASLIREAIELYLKQRASTIGERPAFGIWRDRRLDALAYEERMRSEWQA